MGSQGPDQSIRGIRGTHCPITGSCRYVMRDAAEAWAWAAACSTAPGEHHPVLKQKSDAQTNHTTTTRTHATAAASHHSGKTFRGRACKHTHRVTHSLTHTRAHTHVHRHTRTRSKAHRIMAAGSSRYFTEICSLCLSYACS